MLNVLNIFKRKKENEDNMLFKKYSYSEMYIGKNGFYNKKFYDLIGNEIVFYYISKDGKTYYNIIDTLK